MALAALSAKRKAKQNTCLSLVEVAVLNQPVAAVASSSPSSSSLSEGQRGIRDAVAEEEQAETHLAARSTSHFAHLQLTYMYFLVRNTHS